MNKKNTYIMLSDGKFLEDEVCYEEVKNIIKPFSRVVCIPFACSPKFLFEKSDKEFSYDGDFYKQHYGHFEQYDVSDFYIINPSDPIGFIEWKIEHCDVLYLSGGSMEELKHMLKSFGLWRKIKKIESKIFIAESAGALVLQDEYIVFKNDIPFRRDGLDMVDIVNIFVHYDKEKHKDLFREFKILSDCTCNQSFVYALPNNGGLIIEENKVTKVGEVYD